MNKPSLDEWLKEAKSEKNADQNGMYLSHNGVVRATAKSYARRTEENVPLQTINAMEFSYDPELAEKYVSETKSMPGINYVRIWLNSGKLQVGDDLMLILIGGDIRPHVMEAMNFLIGKIKDECVTEKEII